MNLPDVAGRVLDVVSPLEADGESWTDRDYGTTYCTKCGAESEVVTDGRFLVELGCPSDDCWASTEYQLTHAVGVPVTLGVAAGLLALPPLLAILLALAYSVGLLVQGTVVTRLVEVIQ